VAEGGREVQRLQIDAAKVGRERPLINVVVDFLLAKGKRPKEGWKQRGCLSMRQSTSFLKNEVAKGGREGERGHQSMQWSTSFLKNEQAKQERERPPIGATVDFLFEKMNRPKEGERGH